MTVYNKLVRDLIPELIRSSGEKPVTRILSDEEFLTCLENKLDEEVSEFHKEKNMEELADILEVIYALSAAIGCSQEELMDVFQHKHTQRGGFIKRIFLISKE